MTSYTRIVEIIELLAERWPLAFAVYEQRRQPLQLQIRDQILAALGDAVTLGELSAALGYYTGNYVYLKRTQVGTPRIGLDGQPAGNVTEDEAAHAAEVLAEADGQVAGAESAGGAGPAARRECRRDQQENNSRPASSSVGERDARRGR